MTHDQPRARRNPRDRADHYRAVRSYEYDLTIAHQTGTEIRETVVDNNGEPFRVAGRSCGSDHVATYQAAFTLASGFGVVAEPTPAHIDTSPLLC